MYKKDLEKAEQLHTQWSLLDKASKVVYLRQRWTEINDLIIRIARFFTLTGRSMSSEEVTQFNMLLEMRASLQLESQKATEELANEALQELLKDLLKKSSE